MNTKRQLTHAEAMTMIAAIRQTLEARGQGAAVAVADDHGELLAFLRTDGCPLASIKIAQHKAFTSSRERAPSGVVGGRSRAEGWPMTNFGDLRYTAWGGGLPITIDDETIGAVAVSGLSEEEDIALAQIGLDALAL